MRAEVERAASGWVVEPVVSSTPVSVIVPTGPEPGSGDTSQRSVLLKKVVGSVMWYDAYLSVWTVKRSSG